MYILLSGCVDLFLQDGMQKLDSFLKDTLKVIEEVNEKIDAGQLNLDGVAVRFHEYKSGDHSTDHQGE